MIEIQIWSILSLFWKHNTFLAVYCTLFIRYIFKNKQKQKKAKQISKQNKTKKKKKKEKGKKKVKAESEPGTFGLTRTLIATTPLRMNAWIVEKSQV